MMRRLFDLGDCLADGRLGVALVGDLGYINGKLCDLKKKMASGGSKRWDSRNFDEGSGI
jgi:hypothetical protein